MARMAQIDLNDPTNLVLVVGMSLAFPVLLYFWTEASDMKQDDNPLEKFIETKVCEYARNNYGVLTRKFTSPAHRSVPDRLMLGPRNSHYFIEFKRRGEVPTPAQEREIERLRSKGHRVYVVDNIEEGKRVVKREHKISFNVPFEYNWDRWGVFTPQHEEGGEPTPALPEKGD